MCILGCRRYRVACRCSRSSRRKKEREELRNRDKSQSSDIARRKKERKDLGNSEKSQQGTKEAYTMMGHNQMLVKDGPTIIGSTHSFAFHFRVQLLIITFFTVWMLIGGFKNGIATL